VLNLGFDLDEVICKTAEMALHHLNDIFNYEYSFDALNNFCFEENSFSNKEDEQRIMVECLLWAIKDPVMMSSVKPYKEAVKAIKFLKHQGHKIFIVTKRGKDLKEITEKWLILNNVKYDKLIITDVKNKGDAILKYKLDCFVDDLEDNLYDLFKAQPRWNKGLMLLTKPWNVGEYIDKSKFIRVNNWQDILRNINVGNRLKG